MTKGSLIKSPIELEQRFQSSFNNLPIQNYLPNDNIGVSKWHLVLTNDKPNQFQLFQWGFILFWMEGSAIANRTINAGVETIFEKPAFKEAAFKRRCLIPFDGFFEYKQENGVENQFNISRKDGNIFCVAGIWEQFISSAGKDIPAFLPLTHEANEIIQPYNSRMPFILQPGYESLWLNSDIPANEIVESIEPFPSELLKVNRVSR
mgnify:CR=1 FL=1